MIIKRTASGDINQATTIFETETTYLVRNNIVPSKDEEDNIIEGQVSYDEYEVKKENFQLLNRLALSNATPTNEIENELFQILRANN